MRERFYCWAPLILGVAGALFGIGSYMVHAMLDIDEDGPLWSLIAIVQALGGLYLGLLLKRLAGYATTDALTGLKNRRYAHRKLAEELKHSMSIAMIDVDNFKVVNDTYGHLSGDTLLAALAALVKRTVRQTDIVIRWGGDEFLVIFPHTGVGEAMAIAERIRKAVEEKYGREQVTLSIGVAAVPPDADLSRALSSVDSVLYLAKGCKNAVMSVPAGNWEHING